MRLLVAALCVACCALLAGGPARAMTLQVVGERVFATGPVEDDLLKFEQAFAQPGVTTVVFVNSPGGDLWTGLRVGNLIAEKGLDTVAAGSCVSACSIMFMGGRERRFADSFRPAQTFVGIHGSHDTETKRLRADLQSRLFAFYKLRMGERFDAAVMNRALYDMEDAGGLLRVPESTRSPAVVFHCRSAQTPRSQCTDLQAVDAVSLGVVTQRALVTLELPPSLREVPRLAGQELTVPAGEMQAYLADVAERRCQRDACKALVARLANADAHRAIAFPLSGPGVATASGRNTAFQAALAAVHACNHIAGQPVRLCEAEMIDGFDARPVYRASDEAHREALARLQPPAERFYANEEYGGDLTSANGLRTQRLADITPRSLEGVRLVGTRDLAEWLRSATPVVVIDVGAADNQGIPGSRMLVAGGLAFDDAARDALYEAKLLALVQLFAPDRSQPVVVYGPSRNHWSAVNAALRLKRAGYTQLGWYRGGLEAWKAAGLPTAQVAARAVANFN